MAKVNVTLTVQVVGGPTINEAKELVVEAYDKIDVVIEPDKEKSIEVQPSEGKRIGFLVIKSSVYSDSTKNIKITYGIDDAGKIELDQPHLYLGSGVVSLLGNEPKILKFKNASENKPENKAELEILVGRDATPE
ncbi:hypothetical protein [Dendronalium sp. ChiSLP03b]|uniref:hypothetical protein n=1 Tax=Dendronalium sp. ChiSLP03b TaxID=3075381 RepID=UPI002AD3CA2C|nr:hypothetical protein [Dendronalium sp. ChiSLP03b]MDZ8203797.1 hypothetical protein [Dendronalium sp. ChiSLP03b]